MINLIIGLIIGSIIGIFLMCLLQINRDNKAQRRINKAIEYIENPRHEMSVRTYQNLLEILGGDVDDD